jgi:hypothetical protein
MLGPKEIGFEVWPENWPAVQAFLTVQTQWASSMSGATGLDYTRVHAGLEMAGIECTPKLFAELRLMEGAALEEFSRARKVTDRTKG